MHKQLLFPSLITEDEQLSLFKIQSLALELFHFVQFFSFFVGVSNIADSSKRCDSHVPNELSSDICVASENGISLLTLSWLLEII